MFKEIRLVGALFAALAAPIYGQTPIGAAGEQLIAPAEESMPCPAQDVPKEKIHTLNLGYNALEAAFGGNSLRTRLFTDVAIGKKFQLGYSGLNEMNDADPQTYFGKHVLTAGKRNWLLVPEVVLKTDAHGLISAQAGVKTTGIAKALDGYGWVEANAGEDAGVVAMFYGKTFGPFGMEVIHSMTFSYSGKPQHYTELQPFVSLGNGYFGFARAEVDDGKFSEATYLAGVGKKF